MWHVRDATHRVEVHVQLDTPRRVLSSTGSQIEVEGVLFRYENGMPCYSAAGIEVYGRKVMFNGRLREGNPVSYYLHFTEHPWLHNIRRDIEDSYRIERTDEDDPAPAGTAAEAA